MSGQTLLATQSTRCAEELGGAWRGSSDGVPNLKNGGYCQTIYFTPVTAVVSEDFRTLSVDSGRREVGYEIEPLNTQCDALIASSIESYDGYSTVKTTCTVSPAAGWFACWRSDDDPLCE